MKCPAGQDWTFCAAHISWKVCIRQPISSSATRYALECGYFHHSLWNLETIKMPYARSLAKFAGPAKGLAMQGQNCPERQIICVGVSGNDKRPALIPGYAMPPDRVRWFAVNRRTGMFADSRWGVGPAFPYRNACHHVLRRTLPTARWTLA